MYNFLNVHNNLIPGRVPPKLQVNWSAHRAWHGDTVKILVRTEHVKDGTTIKLEIKTKGQSIDSFDKEKINSNALDKDYLIDWKKKKLPAGAGDFVITGTIKDLNITATSPALTVDLAPPAFSL
jgi:hypothetical protein